MNTANAKKTKAGQKGLEGAMFNVSRVRVIEGQNGDFVIFTLNINGVDINSCRIASGKNGDFVSFPQYKGSDGKYYSHAWAPISDEQNEHICQLVQEAIDNM